MAPLLSQTTSRMPLIASGLCTTVVVGAMVLPYLPGRYDPLAAGLGQAMNLVAFAGLLLVPPGVAWLISGREYVLANAALAMALLVSILAALAMAATTSVAAGAVMAVATVAWIARCWRRLRVARLQGANLSRAIPVALILAPSLVVVASRMLLVEAAEARARERGGVDRGHRTLPRPYRRLSCRPQLALA